jgi:hypothetical protein
MKGLLQYQLSSGEHHSGKIKLLCDHSVVNSCSIQRLGTHSTKKKIQLLEKNVRLKTELFSARMYYIELKFFVI